MRWIDGGVTAPQGFAASGVACGLKKNGRPDLALLVSMVPAAAAGVFTANQIKGHSLLLTRSRLGRDVRGVVINSGNANACLGERGEAIARRMTSLAAEALGVEEEEILAASTGVIGQPMELAAVAGGVKSAAGALSPTGGNSAAEAIMTTDTYPKQAALALRLGAREVRIGGMAKGSGMIHPNMATLLGFLTTDAPVGREGLALALHQAVEGSFNAVTVDGDTSPCDSVLALANGQTGGEELMPGSPEFAAFAGGLSEVAKALARMVARDGEGATKFVTILVRGARTAEEGRRIGRSVAVSPLVKTAVFGADANWGRILSAVGNAGVAIQPECVRIRLGPLLLCAGGAGVPFSEEEAKAALEQRELTIEIDLGLGTAEATVWTCDLSHDYIRINGSYRT